MSLAIAVMALSGTPKVKVIDIDRYNTPYIVNLTLNGSDTHNWYNLPRSQCLFQNRGSNLQILSNPSHVIFTFTLGGGHQKFSSPQPVAWDFTMDYFMNDGASVDLSAVDRFYVDFSTIPANYGPDIPRLSAYDTAYRGGTVSWFIRPGGIYFKKSSFPSNIDWKHIRALALRQDFTSFPNPTTYDVSRFYVSLVPVTAAAGP